MGCDTLDKIHFISKTVTIFVVSKSISSIIEFKMGVIKMGQSNEVGRYLETTRDVKKGDVLWSEKPLVVSPVAVTPPVCLKCLSLSSSS